MKGTMKVNELNKSGLYISEVDWDKCYKSESNPDGNFVMIIEPLEGWDKGIIAKEFIEARVRKVEMKAVRKIFTWPFICFILPFSNIFIF